MKSEKPTPRRLKKESEKGKSFNSRDITVAVVLAGGIGALLVATSLQGVGELYVSILESNFELTPARAVKMAIMAFLRGAMPVAVVAIVLTVLVSLVQSRGVLATDRTGVDFSRLNPVSGLKNMFSLRVVKDLVRTLLYVVCAAAAVTVLWDMFAAPIFSLIHAQGMQMAGAWLSILGRFSYFALLAMAPVFALAAFLDYRLYIRELRMDKSEIKQERKDTEGNEEIKRKRRDLGVELSAQVQADVAGSSMILANPTHIAVGIYAHAGHVEMPFVSVRERGARARKVIALAERLGIPVVRDIRVARAVYASSRRYRFVDSSAMDGVVRLLHWLKDVEQSAQVASGSGLDGQVEP